MDGIEIISSWIVNCADVVQIGARYPSGKKIPLDRKKRGKKLTEAGRLVQQHKAASARERRRVGAVISRRD